MKIVRRSVSMLAGRRSVTRTLVLPLCALFPVVSTSLAAPIAGDSDQDARPGTEASAQVNSGPQPSATAQSKQTGSAESLQEIVVTGTRITQHGYDQPTPVTAVSADTLQQMAPTTLADGLNQLPQFSGSVTRAQCCGGQFAGDYLNLRNIGSSRLLVLLDGQRIAPTTDRGLVNVDLMPELLIKRVDVVTGGASAAYGSDAVSGVVNYVVDDQFEGFKSSIQRGQSGSADDASTKIGLAGGLRFADGRGHAVASLEHFKSNGLHSQSARAEFNQSSILLPNDSGVTTTYNGILINSASAGGAIVDNDTSLPIASSTAPLAGLRFTDNGTGVVPFRFGAQAPYYPFYSVGGDGFTYGGTSSPTTSLQTEKMFTRVSYDLSDHIQAFARVTASQSRTSQYTYGQEYDLADNFTIFRDNAFLPASVGALMDANGVNSFNLGKWFTQLGNFNIGSLSRFYDARLGLQGTFSQSGTWQVSYSHGQSQYRGNTSNDVQWGRLYAATDAVRDPTTGDTVCRVTLTNPGAFPGCAPLNVFGVGTASQTAIDYVSGTSTNFVKNTLDDLSLNVQDKVLALPTGDVSVAAGAEIRRRALVEDSNPVALASIQNTGVNGMPTALCPTPTTCLPGGWVVSNYGEADATDSVEEGYLETVVPLLKDLPAARSLDLDAGIRYTHYKNSGGVPTWKLGIGYKPVNDLRVRTTWSRDIRAPNLYELFAGPVNGFAPGLSDPLTGQTNVFAQISTRGNSALRPEVGTTYTGGLVYTPAWLSGLNASLDYYHIALNRAIGQTDAQLTIDQCVGGDTAACALIVRDPVSKTIVQINVEGINLNSLQTSGVDLDLAYTADLGPGKFSTRVLFNYLMDYVSTSGGVRTEYAGVFDPQGTAPLPKTRGNLTFMYDLGRVSAFVQERYLGRYAVESTTIPGVVYASGIPAVFYTDFTLNWKVSPSHLEAYATVRNVFNKKPPLFPNPYDPGLGVPTVAGLYDLDGVYFTVGLRGKF